LNLTSKFYAKSGNYSAYLSKNHHLWQEKLKSRLFAICSHPKCGDFSPKLVYATTYWASRTMAE
jgi:hypothetical protein